ncbi:MAG: hypothetical protein M1833_006596 [Piccolia ochrophora]|nr:MAG: hypothetical protein M1833_006596 [Piccolia ochrophora]
MGAGENAPFAQWEGSTALLFTNRQISAEARFILYTENVFRISRPSNMLRVAAYNAVFEHIRSVTEGGSPSSSGTKRREHVFPSVFTPENFCLIRHYQIVVADMPRMGCVMIDVLLHRVETHFASIAAALGQSPMLKSVDFSYDSPHQNPRFCARVMQPLFHLRRVGKVSHSGNVPTAFGRFWHRAMEGEGQHDLSRRSTWIGLTVQQKRNHVTSPP